MRRAGKTPLAESYSKVYLSESPLFSTAGARRASLGMSGDGSISASCPCVGIIDPGTIITMNALIFLRLHRFSRRRRALLVLQNSAEPPSNTTPNTAATVDASQMKFSSPSRETVSPFVFIILTRLFKELSSSASVCHSLPDAPQTPPLLPGPTTTTSRPPTPIYLELISSEVQRCVSVTAPCLGRRAEGWEGLTGGTSLPR